MIMIEQEALARSSLDCKKKKKVMHFQQSFPSRAGNVEFWRHG